MHSVITNVGVERDEDGALVVTWALDGPDDGVEIAVGPRPDAIDHDTATNAPAGARAVTVGAVPAAQAYVCVSPRGSGSGVVAAERRVPFDAVVNFRDLGGYATADGRRTRWGRVFRSDSFHALTDADVARFVELGVRVIYDLRTPGERAASPNIVPADGTVREVGLPLSSGEDEQGALPSLDELLEGDRFMIRLYRGMIANGGPVFGALLGGLAAADGLPAVFHCAWGKDRTGMAAALLLGALGVPQPDIVDDYLLTERFRSPEAIAVAIARLQDAGVPPEAAAGVVSAPGWVVDQVLTELNDTYGSIEAYLLGPARLAPEALATLRRELLTD